MTPNLTEIIRRVYARVTTAVIITIQSMVDIIKTIAMGSPGIVRVHLIEDIVAA
jgi:hypothetical protein